MVDHANGQRVLGRALLARLLLHAADDDVRTLVIILVDQALHPLDCCFDRAHLRLTALCLVRGEGTRMDGEMPHGRANAAVLGGALNAVADPSGDWAVVLVLRLSRWAIEGRMRQRWPASNTVRKA